VEGRAAVTGDEDAFRREYVGHFPGGGREFEAACILWARYYARTEAHDERVCASRVKLPGMARAEAIPVLPWERLACSRNAAEERARTERAAREMGIDAGTVQRARGAVMNMADFGEHLLACAPPEGG
jgi:hypothetical protein